MFSIATPFVEKVGKNHCDLGLAGRIGAKSELHGHTLLDRTAKGSDNHIVHGPQQRSSRIDFMGESQHCAN